MFEDIKGKTLLVMDRTALAACAVKRAREMGIKTIVANFYKYEESPSKQVADKAIDIDISDIDAMTTLVKENHVDGIFVGWTDSHLPYYVKICERTGLPCCGTAEQFEILSNDKKKFKQTCRKYGVPTPLEYNLDISFNRKDLNKITYPVIVKPTDGSGSRGIKRCDTEEELIEYYKELYKNSISKKILVEQYIDSDKEIFIHYTIQDGYCSLSSTFMKQKIINEGKVASSAILHVFPSSYLDLYRQTAEQSVIHMFKSLGLKNCIVMMQGFIKDGQFYFYESGLRMGGEQFYVFADPLNGINALDLMIEYSLTGKMTCGDVKKQDNPYFSKSCCNYYITLKPGKITAVSGIEEIEKMPQVLQNTTFKKIGDVISKTNSLDRVIYRIHVMDETPEALASTLEKISNKLNIMDQDNNEMQLERLTYSRALEMICNS